MKSRSTLLFTALAALVLMAAFVEPCAARQTLRKKQQAHKMTAPATDAGGEVESQMPFCDKTQEEKKKEIAAAEAQEAKADAQQDVAKPDSDLWDYDETGADWTQGTCPTGKHQSPVTIKHEVNTIEDKRSSLRFHYEIEDDSVYHMKYDGLNINLDTPIGSFRFIDGRGFEEKFTAKFIKFHYPAEHVLQDGDSTQQPQLEMQIYHTMDSTTDAARSAEDQQNTVGVISVLYNVGTLKDEFLNKMGIRSFKDGDLKLSAGDTPEKLTCNKELMKGERLPGLDKFGLRFLEYALGVDQSVYVYDGSGTTPPCKENTKWFVFAEPRTMSEEQMEFFKTHMTYKVDDGSEDAGGERFKSVSQSQTKLLAPGCHGNNRIVQNYDEKAHVGDQLIRWLKYGIQGF